MSLRSRSSRAIAYSTTWSVLLDLTHRARRHRSRSRRFRSNWRRRWLWFGSRHRIAGKPIFGELTTDARKKWSQAPCTLSLFAINSGELFEIYAIAKERYRVETLRDAKKHLQRVSLRFALEKCGGGRFRSLKTTDRDGATSDDRRLG
jgi:hypothetical protein